MSDALVRALRVLPRRPRKESYRTHELVNADRLWADYRRAYRLGEFASAFEGSHDDDRRIALRARPPVRDELISARTLAESKVDDQHVGAPVELLCDFHRRSTVARDPHSETGLTQRRREGLEGRVIVFDQENSRTSAHSLTDAICRSAIAEPPMLVVERSLEGLRAVGTRLTANQMF